MKKTIIIIVIFFVTSGYATAGWEKYYPYSKINPKKLYKNLPIDYEDCLKQFDSILSDEIIAYYRDLDSTIAFIEIAQEMGGFFINFWNLSFYQEKPYTDHFAYSKRMKYKPMVLDKFINDGISDPEAIIRVLFKCYHKKLNHVPYNWELEIQTLKSYWHSSIQAGWVSEETKKREYEILIDYHFQTLEINDTVDILYNTPYDWYYLTGIIQSKIPEQKAIRVKLIDIQSRFGKNYMRDEEDKIVIGDTLTEHCEGWLKRGIYYMDYHRNKEYRQRFVYFDSLKNNFDARYTDTLGTYKFPNTNIGKSSFVFHGSLGATVFPKNVQDYFRRSFLNGGTMSLDLFLENKTAFSLFLMGGGGRLKQDITLNQEWITGDTIDFWSYGISAGYSFLRTLRWRFTTWGGIALVNSKLTSSVNKNQLKLGVTASPIIGVNFSYRFINLKNYKPRTFALGTSGAGGINFRLSYIPFAINKKQLPLSGGLWYLTLGINLEIFQAY